MTVISTLTVKVGGDMGEVLKGLDAVGVKAKQLGEGIVRAGKAFQQVAVPMAAVGAAALTLVVRIGNAADKLLDLEQQTGLSTDALQEFRRVSTLAGVEQDTLARAAEQMTLRFSRGAEGSADLRSALTELGIDARDAGGNLRPMSEVVTESVAALAAMEDVTTRNVLATKLFSRGASDLAPILGLGADAIRAARDEAHELGLVLDRDALESANAFRIEWDSMKASLQAVEQRIALAILPLMDDLVGALNDGVVPALRGSIEKLTEFTRGLELTAVDAAVAIAKMEVAFARLEEDKGVKGFLTRISGLGEGRGVLDPFGLQDRLLGLLGVDLGRGVDQAELHLQRMEKVAAGLRAEILNLNTDLATTGAEVATLGTAAEVATHPLLDVSVGARDLELAIDTTLPAVTNLADGLEALADAGEQGSNALDKLAGATAKLGQASSFLGTLGRIPGLGFLTQLAGPAGLGARLLGSFAGFFQHGGHIGRGQFGIVGEAGPELVTGPADVTPIGQVIPDPPPFVVPTSDDPLDLRYSAKFMRAFDAWFREWQHQGGTT